MPTVQPKEPDSGAVSGADSSAGTAMRGEVSTTVPPATVWYVYLVRCVDGSLYCGITTHMQRRLAQHNGELAGGAKCTRARRPVVLEGCIRCADRATASRYERQIKKMPREQKMSALLALTS